MPIYEYKCKKCDHIFEEIVSISSIHPPDCPKCKSAETEKLLSTFSGRSSSGSDLFPSMPEAGGCGNSGFS